MELRWYSLNVLSNYEKRVEERIKQLVEEKGLRDEITDVLVPTEKITTIRNGKKVEMECQRLIIKWSPT